MAGFLDPHMGWAYLVFISFTRLKFFYPNLTPSITGFSNGIFNISDIPRALKLSAALQLKLLINVHNE